MESMETFIQAKYDNLQFHNGDAAAVDDLLSVLRLCIATRNNQELGPVLFNAITRSDYPAALLLVYWEAPVYYQHPESGDTLLHPIARHPALPCSPAFIVGLVRRGAPLTVPNAAGHTALEAAVAAGNAAMATLLRVLAEQKPVADPLASDFEHLDTAAEEVPGKVARRKRLLSKLQQLYPSSMVPHRH